VSVPPRLKLGVPPRPPPRLNPEDVEGVDPKEGVLPEAPKREPPKLGVEKLLELEGAPSDPPPKREDPPAPAKRLDAEEG